MERSRRVVKFVHRQVHGGDRSLRDIRRLEPKACRSNGQPWPLVCVSSTGALGAGRGPRHATAGALACRRPSKAKAARSCVRHCASPLRQTAGRLLTAVGVCSGHGRFSQLGAACGCYCCWRVCGLVDPAIIGTRLAAAGAGIVDGRLGPPPNQYQRIVRLYQPTGGAARLSMV
jgi:hypothetical protein